MAGVASGVGVEPQSLQGMQLLKGVRVAPEEKGERPPGEGDLERNCLGFGSLVRGTHRHRHTQTEETKRENESSIIQPEPLILSLIPPPRPHLTPPLPKSRGTLLSNNGLTPNRGERRGLTEEDRSGEANSKQCIWSPQARRISCGWGSTWGGPVSPSTPSS